jgi:catechol 2,3-dioxygenase-like lactoylglutathione lyase family enzyme
MKNKIIKILLIFFTLSSIFAIQAKSHKIIKRPLITRIAHVAIFTKDLESDFQFYKNYLGFSALDVSSKKSADLNSIKINNFQSLKILPEKIKGGNRLSHFSLQTNNADAMRQYLAAKGVKVPEKILKGRLGNRSFFITDPNGTRLEIIQSKASYHVDDRITEIPDTRIANRMSHVGFMVPDLDKALAL